MIGLTVGLLLDRVHVILLDLEVHGDGGGLDRDTTLLLVVSCVRETHVTDVLRGNDTSHADESIRKSRLSVVD
jgi:hypothetical protein